MSCKPHRVIHSMQVVTYWNRSHTCGCSMNDFGGNFQLGEFPHAQYDCEKSGCVKQAYRFSSELFTKNHTFFAMSGAPTSNPKKPELKDLVIALRDLVECHALGLQIGLPESTLNLIDKHYDSKDHLRMMLSEWLQFDPEASWEKLAIALRKIGKNTIAANVRLNSVQSPEQEAKRRKCTMKV